MAVYRYQNGKRVKISPKQLKRLTMANLGLDPEDPEDNKIYIQRYDVLRKRVKAYNILTNKTSTEVSAAETLYRISSRRIAGAELTQEQKNILSLPAANSNNVRRLRPQLENTAIQLIELEFKEFIEKSKEGAKYAIWKNRIIKKKYVDLTTGEIIAPAVAKEIIKKSLLPNASYDDIIAAQNIDIENIRRAQTLTVDAVKKKLYALAKDLYARQKEVYNANKSMYKNAKSTGS